jgi:hypothetical protein
VSSNDLAWLLAGDDDGPDDESLESFAVALDALIFETIRLIDSMLQLDYARGVRRRCAVERVLRRAEQLAATRPEAHERSEALAQLQRMREASRIVLDAAPQPSAVALASARRGDRAAWDREAEAWIADRQREDAPPLIPPRHRRRRDTQPDTPTALRDAAARLAVHAVEPGPTRNKAGSP